MTKHKIQPKSSDPNIYTDETGLERMIFFSDAVFAIAVTLLALEIHLPELPPHASDAATLTALQNLWPKYLSFMISFWAVGSYWLVHHRIFRKVSHYDGRLLMLNLALLLFVSFAPFPTAVLGEQGNRVSTIFYACTMAAIGLVMTAIWWHVAAHDRLLTEPLAPSLFRSILLHHLFVPGIFLASIGLAFWNPDWAQFSWLSIALSGVLWRKQPSR
ncbi:TMEM175 family protein [soil metagenome]